MLRVELGLRRRLCKALELGFGFGYEEARMVEGVVKHKFISPLPNIIESVGCLIEFLFAYHRM